MCEVDVGEVMGRCCGRSGIEEEVQRVEVFLGSVNETTT